MRSTSRLSVSLVDRTDTALAAIVERTGMSKAEIINRAVLFYELIQSYEAEGGHAAAVQADGTTVRLLLI